MVQNATREQLENQIKDFQNRGLHNVAAEIQKTLDAQFPVVDVARPSRGESTGVQRVTLRNVDTERFTSGWGNTWHQPQQVPLGLVPGVTDELVWPTKVKGEQVWLAFRSTDGNNYRDYINIPYETTAIGKLGDICRELGLFHNILDRNTVEFEFPSGIACQLQFEDGQGSSGDQIRIKNVFAPSRQESL